MTSLKEKTTKAPKATKPVPEHKDKLGRKLAIDSMVAYAHGNALHIGKVIKLNPKMIGIQEISSSTWARSHVNIYPSDMVLLEGSDVTFYILKNSA
jgi:uncharacterized protein YcsI (UPF0317 family)